jgi:hypothetical protein
VKERKKERRRKKERKKKKEKTSPFTLINYKSASFLLVQSK